MEVGNGMWFLVDLLERLSAYLFSRAVLILGLLVLVATTPWWVPLFAAFIQLRAP